MTESKHTPGPWESFGGPDFCITDSNGASVAQLWNKYEDYFKPYEESEANARLIAAAPEMLEVLEYIKDWCSKGVWLTWGDTFFTKKIESAIQKARGE